MPPKKRKANLTAAADESSGPTEARTLLSVEQLISLAMGPAQANTVNFKMLQTVLHILARQMRLLGTKCDIRLSDIKLSDTDIAIESEPPTQEDESEPGTQVDVSEPGTGATPVEEKDTDTKFKGKRKRRDSKKPKEASGSGTSIFITETEQDKEKVLVVEKGKPPRRSMAQGSGIEVVTLSKFNLLEAQVGALMKSAGPLPMPAMPDDKKLKEDLVKGSASLTDTMQAMQLAARVQAAERGLAIMADLLTQLAAAGALPQGYLEKIQQARAEVEVLRADLKPEAAGSKKAVDLARKSVAIDAMAVKSENSSRPSSVTLRRSVASVRPIIVTQAEMEEALKTLQEDLLKSMQQVTGRAASIADTAASVSRSVAEKMETAVNLNKRITNLQALASDYAEQLAGFDAGLSTQMQSFNEQMTLMRQEMKGGLVQLNAASNNAETVAVLELTERYQGLQAELDALGTEHGRLTSKQKQLAQELLGLVSAVEMLREQKADRDEVLDGLRDKADMSKLEGLLTEAEFLKSKAELERRLEICYEKFERQEAVWMLALRDISDVVAQKAAIIQILSVKQFAQDQLNEMLDFIKKLEIELGKPKASIVQAAVCKNMLTITIIQAAILTRQLSKDGTCVVCKVPALMEQADKVSGKPPRLPALRPPEDEVCVPPVMPIVVEDQNTKSHMCHRWVGGSHTLVSRSMPREVATKQLVHDHPVKKYKGYGADGNLYNLEEELLPCLECNLLSTDEAKGAGDAEEIKTCPCWPGVTDPKAEEGEERLNGDNIIDIEAFK